MVRSTLLLVFVLVLTSCSDTVTDQYATRAEAKTDQLFERGWLPEIIPKSSKNIVTINDLDSNNSEGEFEFDSEESDAFTANLDELDHSELVLEDQLLLLEKNYVPYGLDGETSTWIFLINSKKGHCRYRMWLR